jgi:hypothetical protein
MVAGSRGGVVTIRHDGDGGATVRSFRMRFSALRRARPLFPRFVLPLVSILAGGWGPVDLRGCGAVRRRVDWVGSVSDWLVVRSLREMPRFCSVPVGDFAAAYWSSEESIGCSLRLAASTRWRRLEMRRGLS